ncbi:MAG: efflux RND transporter periplasmic adaptor subunit [Anaerolineae bacterium]|nr:efflux RND transporter periplasmic adaptor subunit [Anaerolineae bacterium]
MKRKWITILFAGIVIALLVASCGQPADETSLTASGTISAASVDISPEVSGTIQEVLIQAGDRVKTGDALFRINPEFISAQNDQAIAGLAVAEAAVNAAVQQKTAAEYQYELALQGARMQQVGMMAPQTAAGDDGSGLPQWYATEQEWIDALRAEVDLATSNLADATTSLVDWIAENGADELLSLESDLTNTRVQVALLQQQLAGYQQSGAAPEITEVAQDQLDEAQADLDRYQLLYDRLLDEDQQQELLDARGEVQAAEDRLDMALLALDQQLVGDQSLTVAAALANVNLADANITQAQAGLEQARAAAALAALQLEKTTVYAPVGGIILSESLAVGELIGAGMKALSIAQMDQVELTVYVPEDQYGQVSLGQTVTITADSFPNRTFTGEVVHIADEAEFTPRNVQTVEGRKATVFAIRILIQNEDYALKPGMPADVNFE